MRKFLTLAVVVAIAAPAFGVADFFQVTSDGAFNTYKTNGGYGNVGAGGSIRMGKTNQAMGYMGFAGAAGDTSGQSIDAFVQANGGWSNPNVQVTLHFRATDAGLPAVGAKAQPAYNGVGGAAVQIGMYIESVRVGLGAGTGGLVEDQSTSSGNDYGYKPGITTGSLGPPAGFQGASEPVAFRGAQPYQTNDRFFNYGEGIAAGPLGTAAGTAWFTPSGYTKGDFAANAAVQWMAGTMPRGVNISKGGFALEWLLGGFGNNGGARAGALDINGLPTTNDWAQSGQIIAKNPDGTPLVVTAANYSAVVADPRKGTVDAKNVAIPLDLAFAMDLATNPEFRGLVFSNNFNTLGAFWGNTGFYTKEQSGQLIPYLEVNITPEPATLILLALSGVAMLRRRHA